MEANKVTVTLRTPLENGGRQHSFDIVERDGLIFLMVAAQVVATLSVSTMTKEVPDADGDYHTKLTDNFYINFEAADPVAKRDCTAMAWVEKP